MPKASICIPAYNNEASLRRLLESILMQTFQDYEIILTDDSTTDDVRQLVEEYQPQFHAPFYYQRNEVRLGATKNWNESIALSNGEYIKIMHHDDSFRYEDSLEKFVAMLDHNQDAVMAFSGTLQKCGESQRERAITQSQLEFIRESEKNLYIGNYIGAPSATIYRKTGIVFDEKLSWLVDLAFYMKLLSGGKSFAFTTEPLIVIEESETQLTQSCIHDADKNIFEYGYLFREYGLASKQSYREQLIKILVEYNAPFASFSENNISYPEYIKAKSGKMIMHTKGFLENRFR